MKNVIITVANAIVKVVDMQGKRPLRIYMDSAQDAAEVVNAFANHIRAEFLRRIGLGELLTSKVNN